MHGRARQGKGSAKDGRSLQMEEGLWMQHQLEEEKEWRLRSGLEHLLAEHKALQLIIRIFVAREQMNKTHEEVAGKKQSQVWPTSIVHCH